MQVNQSKVLVDIKPISEVIHHTNSDMFPIHFKANSTHYIRWQNRSAIQQTFDCKYDPSQWIPENARSNIIKIIKKIDSLTVYYVHVLSGRERIGNMKNIRYLRIERKKHEAAVDNCKREIEINKIELSEYIGIEKASKVSDLMFHQYFFKKLQKYYSHISVIDEALDEIMNSI